MCNNQGDGGGIAFGFRRNRTADDEGDLEGYECIW
jgi:hypothetical protein